MDVADDNEKFKIYQPLDYSFMDIKDPPDILKSQPRIYRGLTLECPKNQDGKWLTRSFKATNNQLTELSEMPNILAELFGSFDWVTWLDLSCNKINAIPVSIQKLTRLKLFYLHGNQIKYFQDVQRLTKLKELKKLTLHGNPIENEKLSSAVN
ncbi:unnamed protein product [Dicrocoelium dendriticum]|nr:unnamed protein product [Dicrocoelium dendriticum]